MVRLKDSERFGVMRAGRVLPMDAGTVTVRCGPNTRTGLGTGTVQQRGSQQTFANVRRAPRVHGIRQAEETELIPRGSREEWEGSTAQRVLRGLSQVG